jgi:aryl-alcohol dehydrogenase-like predicted oxidoreductase
MSYGGGNSAHHQWSLGEEESRPFIKRALEAGINFFDTANRYSVGKSEEILGGAIRDFARRDEVVIATKVYNRMRPGPNGAGLSRKAIVFEIDESLRRLRMDYVDLYQIHRWDHETPIEETLHDVVKAGKARYIGASSMHAWQFGKALAVAERNGWTRFVSMQNMVNLLYREEEREMLPLCAAEGIGVIPWSPQARGKLTRDWDYKSIRTETDDALTRLFAKTEEADRRVVLTARTGGTLPIVPALADQGIPETRKNGRTAADRELLNQLGSADLTASDVAELQALFVRTGAVDDVEVAIERLVVEARDALAAAPLTETARVWLDELAAYVAWRDS